MPYLDHAATTPVLPEAIAAYTQQLADTGNASSLHSAGRRARRVVEESRETVARALGARPSEVVFTGGGTESINLAVKGLYWARRDATPARRRILAAKVEHHAVLDPLQWLADHEGAEITWLPVDGLGRVEPAVLDEAIREDPDSVAFATVMWANNEIGTVQPIADLVAVAHTYGIPIHSDAIQAVGQLPVDFGASGLDAMTVTGHKFGGPYGVGALLLGRKVEVTPLLHGGGQERDVRSGTLDTPGIAAFATAIEIAVSEQPERATALAELRDDLIVRVLDVAKDAVLNGPGPDASGGPPVDLRLPGNAHFCFPGCEGDSLLLLLDAQGIECSTGSACSAGVAQPSHVLLAIGSPPDLARGSLRFSLGHTSSKADVDALIDALPAVLDRARAAGLS